MLNILVYTIPYLSLLRDLSFYGRVLLSKAEDVSRFVYPALSLYVDDKLCKEISNLFPKFVDIITSKKKYLT